MGREKGNIVKEIVDYLEAHLAEELSLDKIAGELHYSKFYMARIFAERTGITVYKYVQGRRLTEAARELVESDREITDIAYDACYHSQQAFTLAFHRLYGCPPQAYRKRGAFYPKQSKISMCHALCLMTMGRFGAAYSGYMEKSMCLTFFDCIVKPGKYLFVPSALFYVCGGYMKRQWYFLLFIRKSLPVHLTEMIYNLLCVCGIAADSQNAEFVSADAEYDIFFTGCCRHAAHLL